MKLLLSLSSRFATLTANGLAGVFVFFLILWAILGPIGDLILDGIFVTLLIGHNRLRDFAAWLDPDLKK